MLPMLLPLVLFHSMAHVESNLVRYHQRCLGIHPIFRLFLDSTRAGGANADQMIGSMTWSQLSGLGVGLAGFVLILLLARRTPLVSNERDELYQDA